MIRCVAVVVFEDERLRIRSERVYLGCGGNRAGEVRDNPDVVRFAQGADPDHLGDAADVGQRAASKLEVVVLDQFVEVPARAPLLTGGERYAGLGRSLGMSWRNMSVWTGSSTRYGSNSSISRQPRSSLGKREALMEVHREVAPPGLRLRGRRGSRPASAACARVRRRCWCPARSPRRTGTPPALLHARRGAIAQRARPAERCRVALEIVAIHPAEELVDGHAQRLAFEIPQRKVQGADAWSRSRPGG